MSEMRVLHMLHALECPVGQIGVTVRKGFKWADVAGQKIALCVCDRRQDDKYTCPPESIQGHAYVIETWKGTFKDVPAFYLENEHEIAARTYSGLLTSMKRAYGEDFNDFEDVTIVVYMRED